MKKALLDTCTFLWWVTGDDKLSELAKDFISDCNNDIYFSVASAWEIIIKAKKTSKVPLSGLLNIYIPKYISEYDFKVLDINMECALKVWELENHHLRLYLTMPFYFNHFV